MTIRFVRRSTLAFFATLLLSATAHAQLFRTYLAPTGSDANPCTLFAPCRLLPAALAAVADGGEIWMLDSANYNAATVNIIKSVTILAVPGVVGSVVATNGPAIRIATAGVKLALRNLVIMPLPGAGAVHGINMTAGAALTVENCLIANMPTNGIIVSTAAVVRITDTTIRDNLLHGVVLQNGAHATITRTTVSGNTNVGVFAYMTTAGPATVIDIADSTLNGNGAGFTAFTDVVANEIYASISNSRIVQNAANGVSANGGPLGTVVVSATNNTISHNAVVGIVAYNTGGKVWLSGNTVNQNEKGIWAALGIVESAGNNTVRGNTLDTDGTITVIATATK